MVDGGVRRLPTLTEEVFAFIAGRGKYFEV